MKLKKLSEHLHHIQDLIIETRIPSDPYIKKICNDSRKIEDSCLFVAIKGTNSDGHQFISQAISAGATSIIYENDFGFQNDNVQFIRVSDARAAYSRLCEFFFDNPSQKLKLIGITGTNGKTTSAFLTKAILQSCSLKSGLISTVCVDNGKEIFESQRTTPDAFELQKIFYEMTQNLCSHAVMEVSSHSLDQNRIGTAEFAGVIFTNLSGDHLDYHKSFDDYQKVKKSLFDANPRVPKVVNIDDELGAEIAFSNKEVITYGIKKKADVAASGLKLSADSTQFNLHLKGQTIPIKLKLKGKFNVYNSLAAAGAAMALGCSLEEIKQGLEEVENVPGRMEFIDQAQDFFVVVDYAHTPDGLEKVL
ncbi:MAG: UDP-N-acetylmuramoyl-L-alanyl-D-glutamate--2,6-diaminopimelate ligase, partial [Candidatus Nanoarchaeia archaeon]